MAKRNSTTEIPTDGKFIRYDKETKDYACYLDGEFIGYASNYSDAETLCDTTYREQLEAGLFATAAALDAGSSIEEIAVDVESTPAVIVTTWQGEVGTPYTDFHAGAGLTGVMIGNYGSDKDGIELVIGGYPINEHLDEVLTLADERQLRDNLDALLSDARLLAAVE